MVQSRVKKAGRGCLIQQFDFKKSSIKKAEKKCHGVPSDDCKFLLCRRMSPGGRPKSSQVQRFLAYLTLLYVGFYFLSLERPTGWQLVQCVDFCEHQSRYRFELYYDTVVFCTRVRRVLHCMCTHTTHPYRGGHTGVRYGHTGTRVLNLVYGYGRTVSLATGAKFTAVYMY